MSKFAEMMAAAVAEDQTVDVDVPASVADGDAKAPPAEASPAAAADSGASPERGADGKFLPKDGEKPAEAKAEAEETDEEKAAKAGDPKVAARFAALSRKSQKVRESEDKVETRSREVESAWQRVEARQKDVDAKAAEFDLIEKDDDALFAYLEKRKLSAEKIIERAKNPKPPEFVDTKTASRVEQLEKQLKDERDATTHAKNQELATNFIAFLDKDETYSAASMVFSDREKAEMGNQLGLEAAQAGLTWGWKEIADGLNKLAMQDKRYQRISPLLRQQMEQAKPKSGTAGQSANEHPDQSGRRAPEATTLTNQHATERTGTNGQRLSHRDRIARLLGRSDT